MRKSGQEITPKEIQEILESIQDLPNETMISRLTLRNHETGEVYYRMQRPLWTCSENITAILLLLSDGIRIFRYIGSSEIISEGGLTRKERTEHYREILEEVARQSSVCERRAQEAEQESDKMKKAEYMSYHLGEEFDGIISG